MKRLSWRGAAVAAVAVAAVAVPAAANPAASAAWKGIVVAKDPHRSAFVTASTGGVVRTVRTARKARTPTIGQAVIVRATRLHNGTFRALRITAAGRAARVQLRGVLLRYQAGRYFVSAGGSVLAVRGRAARRTAAAAVTSARPGDRVLMTASLTKGSLSVTSVVTLGHATTAEVEGIFLGLSTTGQLRVAVAGTGEVLITVPTGLTLPTLTPGDELELIVSVDTAGVVALVRVGDVEGVAENDQGQDNDDHGEDNDDQGTTTTTTTAATTTVSTPTTTTDDQGDDNDDQGDDNDDQGDDD